MAVRNIVLGRAKSRLNKLSTRLVIVGQLATILRIGFLFLKTYILTLLYLLTHISMQMWLVRRNLLRLPVLLVKVKLS